MIVTAQFSWRDRFGVMTGPRLARRGGGRDVPFHHPLRPVGAGLRRLRSGPQLAWLAVVSLAVCPPGREVLARSEAGAGVRTRPLTLPRKEGREACSRPLSPNCASPPRSSS